MRNKIVAILVASLTGMGCSSSGVGQASSNAAVYETVKHPFWSLEVDPLGNTYELPASLVWAVDPASCGDKVDQLEAGLKVAQSYWSTVTEVPIRPVAAGEKINFVMYCTQFGKFDASRPRAYRVRSIASDYRGVIQRVEVEVPDDWKIINDQRKVYGFDPRSYSAVGVGYLTLGLGLGMKHEYDPGRSSKPPRLDENQEVNLCVKNCAS